MVPRILNLDHPGKGRPVFMGWTLIKRRIIWWSARNRHLCWSFSIYVCGTIDPLLQVDLHQASLETALPNRAKFQSLGHLSWWILAERDFLRRHVFFGGFRSDWVEPWVGGGYCSSPSDLGAHKDVWLGWKPGTENACFCWAWRSIRFMVATIQNGRVIPTMFR